MERISILFLASVAACSGGPGTDGTDTCPEPEDVDVYVGTDGVETDIYISEQGEVAWVRQREGNLEVEIDFSAAGGDPPRETFVVTLPEGGNVDLHEGDVVQVSYSEGSTGWARQARLAIARGEQNVLFALSCGTTCDHAAFRVGPLMLTPITGRCLPQVDDEMCAMWERLGYRITCDGSGVEAEVFDHGQAFVACGVGYHVLVGSMDRFVEWVELCTDLPDGTEQVIVMRTGDGLPP
jgi:hypothetical protein